VPVERVWVASPLEGAVQLSAMRKTSKTVGSASEVSFRDKRRSGDAPVPKHDKPFVSAVKKIYKAALEPAQWPVALQTTADCLGGVGAILLWRRDDGTCGCIASPAVVEAQKDFEQEGWMVPDVRALRAAERGYFFSGEPFTDRHVRSGEDLRTNPSYRQFQARHGLGWFGAVVVSPELDVGVALSVHRAKTRPPFSDAELDVLARLGRHIEKSLRLSIRLFDADMRKVGLGETLAQVDIGVFALDASGRAVFANPAGKSLLGAGLALTNDRLLIGAAPGGKLKTAIKEMIRATPEDVAADRKPILIYRQKSERPLAVYVLPIDLSSHPAAHSLIDTRAIILAIDPDARRTADPALVRDVLGLTLGEARLAALVASGLAPREASEQLGISEETARSVLEQVFAKTGVSRQAELVSLLSRMGT
jgi:DNA-binding CsgD family transcriptional regulator/PAS domain-containing protein